MQALNVLDADTWVAFNAGLGVMMLGAAGSLVPMTGAFRILGWMALLAGIALFIPFADFVALIVTGLLADHREHRVVPPCLGHDSGARPRLTTTRRVTFPAELRGRGCRRRCIDPSGPAQAGLAGEPSSPEVRVGGL